MALIKWRGTHKKIGAIIIYLDILFTRDHFPSWLGTGVRETEGRRNERRRRREGGPQGFGDSWHGRGREGWKETRRRRDGRGERDNVMSVVDKMSFLKTSIYLRLHQAGFYNEISAWITECCYSSTSLIQAICSNLFHGFRKKNYKIIFKGASQHSTHEEVNSLFLCLQFLHIWLTVLLANHIISSYILNNILRLCFAGIVSDETCVIIEPVFLFLALTIN